jgi:hypothetical protein
VAAGVHQPVVAVVTVRAVAAGVRSMPRVRSMPPVVSQRVAPRERRLDMHGTMVDANVVTVRVPRSARAMQAPYRKDHQHGEATCASPQ